MAETEREMVLRHVHQGEAHVRAQLERVEKAKARGGDGLLELNFLRLLKQALATHREHLARLQRPGRA